MPSKDTANKQTEAALNAAQVLFSMNPSLMPQTRHVGEAHVQIMKTTEAFTSAWVRRRHEDRRLALDMVAQVAEAGMQDPASAFKAMADWQTKSLERFAEEAGEWADFMTRCAGGVLRSEVGAMSDTADTAKAASEKHATPV
ncbi:MAG: hypothetical protein EP318_07570 [Rhodobacteraceae bacterium]|nr:MAG: hypothetical protein EP318_07570 [Paracoccaceae bacterium]